MQKIFILISAMRLRTLPLSIAGIILAACLAQYNNVFKWDIFLLAIFTTLSFQILSNLANDYGDGVKGTDNEDRIGPERAIQSGNISPSELMRVIKVNIVLSTILMSTLVFIAFGKHYFFLTLFFFLLGIGAIIAAIRYTVGNHAYGYKGMGDIFVFVFFGLVSVVGCYILFAKQLDTITLLPAFSVGLLSTAVLNLNNMRDRLTDKKSNKITLAVKLGEKNVKIYHNVLIFSAIFLSGLFGIIYYTSLYHFIFIITYVPLLLHLRRVNKNKALEMLDPELKKLALTTVLLALLMGVGCLLPF